MDSRFIFVYFCLFLFILCRVYSNYVITERVNEIEKQIMQSIQPLIIGEVKQ